MTARVTTRCVKCGALTADYVSVDTDWRSGDFCRKCYEQVYDESRPDLVAEAEKQRDIAITQANRLLTQANELQGAFVELQGAFKDALDNLQRMNDMATEQCDRITQLEGEAEAREAAYQAETEARAKAERELEALQGTPKPKRVVGRKVVA